MQSEVSEGVDRGIVGDGNMTEAGDKFTGSPPKRLPYVVCSSDISEQSRIMKALSFLSLFASLAVAERVSYDGHKVFRIYPTRGLSISAISDVLQNIEHDEWNKDASDIVVSIAPDQLPAFEALGLRASVMHEDLGRSIADESRPSSVWKRQVDDLSWYDSYHDYEDHVTYFEELQAAFPNNSEIVSTGTSYEGRDMYGIHIWGADGPGKPAVVWHGTVHAREWISAPVVEYLALQLLSEYGSDDDVKELVDTYDYYIFPFVNPDGKPLDPATP